VFPRTSNAISPPIFTPRGIIPALTPSGGEESTPPVFTPRGAVPSSSRGSELCQGTRDPEEIAEFEADLAAAARADVIPSRPPIRIERSRRSRRGDSVGAKPLSKRPVGEDAPDGEAASTTEAAARLKGDAKPKTKKTSPGSAPKKKSPDSTPKEANSAKSPSKTQDFRLDLVDTNGTVQHSLDTTLKSKQLSAGVFKGLVQPALEQMMHDGLGCTHDWTGSISAAQFPMELEGETLDAKLKLEALRTVDGQTRQIRVRLPNKLSTSNRSGADAFSNGAKFLCEMSNHHGRSFYFETRLTSAWLRKPVRDGLLKPAMKAYYKWTTAVERYPIESLKAAINGHEASLGTKISTLLEDHELTQLVTIELPMWEKTQKDWGVDAPWEVTLCSADGSEIITMNTKLSAYWLSKPLHQSLILPMMQAWMRSSGRQLSPAALNHGLLVSVDGVEVANTHAIKAQGYVVEASEVIKVVITMVAEVELGAAGMRSKQGNAASTSSAVQMELNVDLAVATDEAVVSSFSTTLSAVHTQRPLYKVVVVPAVEVFAKESGAKYKVNSAAVKMDGEVVDRDEKVWNLVNHRVDSGSTTATILIVLPRPPISPPVKRTKSLLTRTRSEASQKPTKGAARFHINVEDRREGHGAAEGKQSVETFLNEHWLKKSLSEAIVMPLLSQLDSSDTPPASRLVVVVDGVTLDVDRGLAAPARFYTRAGNDEPVNIDITIKGTYGGVE